jgi:hypothetical protein
VEPIKIQWASQSYRLDSLPVSSQRCVNLYAEKEPTDAKTDIAVIACPGILHWVSIGPGGIRGLNVMNNILYVVSGVTLYSISVAGTITQLGTGILGFGPVSMANNGSQVEIVNGVSGWIYAPSSTFNASTGVPVAGGSAYIVGDQITIGGGTYSSPAVLSVASVLAAITNVGVQTPGVYTVLPTNPVSQASTSGSGSGALFEMTWTSASPYSAATVALAFGGTDYQIGDTIAIAGGTFSVQLVLVVEDVASGAIASVSVFTPGQYTVVPTNPAPQVSTTGVGSGATFTMTFTGPPVGFTEISGLAPAMTVTFFDTYFINDVIGTNLWVYSNNQDGTDYPPLNFNEASVDSSFVLATVNQQENLLIFKQKSIETWYDTGANNDPFSRYDGATIERGCAAALAIVKEDNGVFFLGNDLIFYRLDGVELRRLSTHAIEAAWQKYTNPEDAYAFSYTFNGHKFIVVQFPSNQATWEFDVATNLWHERVSYVATSPFSGPWRGNCSVVFNNQTLIGDAQTGQIGYLSDAIYTEFGSPMIGFADSPPVNKDRKRIFISKLELNMQVGDAPQTGQGSDPQIMLEISRDQGRTYGIRQLWMSLGKTGAYATRLIWKKLGKARDWRFRIVVSDPVPRTFIAAYATADIEEV